MNRKGRTAPTATRKQTSTMRRRRQTTDNFELEFPCRGARRGGREPTGSPPNTAGEHKLTTDNQTLVK